MSDNLNLDVLPGAIPESKEQKYEMKNREVSRKRKCGY